MRKSAATINTTTAVRHTILTIYMYGILILFMGQSDIKAFIDFFHDVTVRIRNRKAVFVRGKDGALVRRALEVFTRPQLEMLALWFLATKEKMSPTIGAMLSSVVLEELKRKIADPHFWKELDHIHEIYYPQPDWHKELEHRTRAFNGAQLVELQTHITSR